MSLINDALKRAKQAQKQDPPPAVPGAPLRPAEIAARRAPTSGIIWLLLGALVLGVTAAVLFFLVFRGGKNGAPSLAQPTTPPAAAVPAKPEARPPAPVPSPAAALTPKAVSTNPPVTPPVVATPAPSAPAATPATPPETPPATNAPAPLVVTTPALPKLQGILFRSDRPSALLNGKTVFVGSRSGEFLVVAITQESVTVVRGGVTNVLSLVQ